MQTYRSILFVSLIGLSSLALANAEPTKETPTKPATAPSVATPTASTTPEKPNVPEVNLTAAEVQKKINSEIEKVNRKLAPFEHIKRAKLINDEWTPINGMLSQTLKLKRNNIKTKYFDTINDIFKLDN